MTLNKKAWRILPIFICGVFLSFVLYVLAGAFMQSHFQLQKQLVEAHGSDAAYANATATFRTMNEWRDFVALPIIGCLVGVYAALCQKKKASILAVACLLPMLVFEATGVSVQAWPFITDLQVLASRTVEFLLAIVVAASVRGFLNRRNSSLAR